MMNNIIYGKNSFFEALKNKRIIKAYVLNDKEIKDYNIDYKIVDRKYLDKLSSGANHQGYICEVSDFKLSNVNEMIKDKNGLIILLDELNDVHNLGAIIRTADGVNADGIIYKKHNNVRVNATVSKIASGALEYAKIAEVSNLVYTVKDLKKKGYWIIGTDGTVDKLYTEIDYNMNIALIIGSEGKGISRLLKEECDFLIKIPMLGHISSLNASVAAGIILYHILDNRQST